MHVRALEMLTVSDKSLLTTAASEHQPLAGWKLIAKHW